MVDSRVLCLAEILRLNTQLFRNCLDSLDDGAAAMRPSSETNNIAFIAAHVTDARFFLLRVLNAEHPNPMAAYLKDARGIDDLKRLPTLGELQAAWTDASRALRDRLPSLTAAELDGPSGARLPGPELTMLDTLTFLVQHDSHHIGQLALLRKYVGFPAMTYP
jgi:uncharacterized damage-inducible protein DinB